MGTMQNAESIKIQLRGIKMTTLYRKHFEAISLLTPTGDAYKMADFLAETNPDFNKNRFIKSVLDKSITMDRLENLLGKDINKVKQAIEEFYGRRF